MSVCCGGKIGGGWLGIGLLGIALIGGGAIAGLRSVQGLESKTEQATKVEEEKLLRHVVIFKFKESSSPEEIQKVVDAFRALPSKVPQVAEFEFGENNSPEGLNDGFTHCFLITFKTEEDRAQYLPHPAHQEFVGVLKPHLDKALVVDYWAAK